MTNKDLVKEWIDYAERDLSAADYLTSMRPVPQEIICFHCQQATEKALKALLAYANVRVPKTHDLDELLELCSIYKDLSDFREETLPLNDYAVITRYPDIRMVNKEDMKQALLAAKKVVDFVKKETL